MRPSIIACEQSPSKRTPSPYVSGGANRQSKSQRGEARHASGTWKANFRSRRGRGRIGAIPRCRRQCGCASPQDLRARRAVTSGVYRKILLKGASTHASDVVVRANAPWSLSECPTTCSREPRIFCYVVHAFNRIYNHCWRRIGRRCVEFVDRPLFGRDAVVRAPGRPQKTTDTPAIFARVRLDSPVPSAIARAISTLPYLLLRAPIQSPDATLPRPFDLWFWHRRPIEVSENAKESLSYGDFDAIGHPDDMGVY
jgi:hypothetical protein